MKKKFLKSETFKDYKYKYFVCNVCYSHDHALLVSYWDDPEDKEYLYDQGLDLSQTLDDSVGFFGRCLNVIKYIWFGRTKMRSPHLSQTNISFEEAIQLRDFIDTYITRVKELEEKVETVTS